MTVENAWELFRKTGLPEADELYSALREKGGADAGPTLSPGDSSSGKSTTKRPTKY